MDKFFSEFYHKKSYEFSDVEELIKRKVQESHFIEFKRQVGTSRDVVCDICAFANADGGIIVYGMEEQNHVAHSIHFIDANTYDKERLMQVINDNINQKIEHLFIYPIAKDNDISKTVYLVKVPKPEDLRCTRKGEYYIRTSTLSVPMLPPDIKKHMDKENDVLMYVTANGVILVELVKIKERFSRETTGRNWGDACNILEELYKYSNYAQRKVQLEVALFLLDIAEQTRNKMPSRIASTVQSLAYNFFPYHDKGGAIEFSKTMCRAADAFVYDALIYLNNFNIAATGLTILKWLYRKNEKTVQEQILKTFQELKETLQRPERKDLGLALKLVVFFEKWLEDSSLILPGDMPRDLADAIFKNDK